MGHTIFPKWYDSMEFEIGLIEITVITRISASSKLMQVPFSFATPPYTHTHTQMASNAENFPFGDAIMKGKSWWYW